MEIQNLTDFKFTPLRWLQIILSILIIISLIISCWLLNSSFWGNLILNLAVELFGILLVISGVDWVMKKNDEKKWAKSMNLILKKISKFNNQYTTIIRVFLDIKIEIPYDKEPTEENVRKFNLKILDFSEREILPNITDKIFDASLIKWKELCLSLKKLNDEIIQIIMLFGDKLNPCIYSNLLRVQIKIENNMESYTFLHYIPPANTVEIQNFKKHVAEDLKYTLKIVIELNRYLLDITRNENDKNEHSEECLKEI
jgi:hypothetical protein